MNAAYLLHCGCDPEELPLAAYNLYRALVAPSAANEGSAVSRDGVVRFEVWLDRQPPAVSPRGEGTDVALLAYAGDAVRWEASVREQLERGGIEGVLSERSPEEWSNELSDADFEWLVERWVPLPVSWGEGSCKSEDRGPVRHWIVVREAEGQGVSRVARARVPESALVEAGMASERLLEGSPPTWHEQVRGWLAEGRVGVVGASEDAVVNAWLGAIVRGAGASFWCAAPEGGFRWRARGGAEDAARPEIRPTLEAWMRSNREAEISDAASVGVVRYLQEALANLRGTEGLAPELDRRRSVFVLPRGGSTPDVQSFLRGRGMLFWRALLGGSEDMRSSLLEASDDRIAEVACSLAEGAAQSGWYGLIEQIHQRVPAVWMRVGRALERAGFDRMRPQVRLTLADGLFHGVAHGMRGIGCDDYVETAAEWSLRGLGGRDGDAGRAMAFSTYLATSRLEEANETWRRYARSWAPEERTAALWRSFRAWAPAVEGGETIPDGVSATLTGLVRSLGDAECTEPLVPLLEGCLRLYGMDEGDAAQPVLKAWRQARLPVGIVGAFALFCWIRGACGTGVVALDHVGGSWPDSTGEQMPLYCAATLLAPERAKAWRATLKEPDEEYLRRVVPSHTRAFFWALALAAHGDRERAHQMRLRAQLDDPWTRVRQAHWPRVGLNASESKPASGSVGAANGVEVDR
jgi:hypothetical protein